MQTWSNNCRKTNLAIKLKDIDWHTGRNLILAQKYTIERSDNINSWEDCVSLKNSWKRSN